MAKINNLNGISEKLREYINKIQEFLSKAINTYLSNDVSTSIALINTKEQLQFLKEYINTIDF